MMDFSLITDEPLNYCVYAHVNKTNGKMYIGVTNNTKHRWGTNGNGYKSCPHFWSAIQKYGWDNFEHIVLIDGVSLSIAHVFERELISKYDAIANGYNIKEGGQSGDKFRTLGPRKHNRPIYQYDLLGNFIKKWDKPIEASQFYGVQDVTSSANHGWSCAGYQWSYEYVDKMSPYSNDKNHLYLPIYQYSKEGEFIKEWETQKEAIEQYSVSIRNCIYGTSRTSYGYRWSLEKVDKLPPLPPVDYTSNRKKKERKRNPMAKYEHSEPVYRFDLDGNLIRTYDNCAAVDDVEDVKPASIYKLCHRENAYVYHDSVWVFEKDTKNGYVNFVIEKHKRLHPKIVQYSLNGEYVNSYDTMIELEEIGFNHSNISNACTGGKRTAYGYQWRFDYDDAPQPIVNLKNGSPKAVIQKTLDGKFVKQFRSARAAAEELSNSKIPVSTKILNVCNGKAKTAYGYLWEFVNKEVNLDGNSQ